MSLCGGKDFPIFEPVKNCPVPKIWQKHFWKPFHDISRENTYIILSHIRFAPTAWLAFWLARRKNISYIHIEHGTGFLIHDNFLIRNIAKIVDLTIGKYILKSADFVVCVSKSGEKWVRDFSGRTENIQTIYRGFTPYPSPLLQ